MTNDVERFDEWSETYENSWIQRFLDPLHELMLESVLNPDPGFAPDVIVDVGCGTGRLLRKAASHWPRSQMVGVDPAPGMIEVARKRTPNAAFHQASAESLPIADGAADLVLSAVSMHHWNDAAQGVREIARVLHSGGIFCLADITVPAWIAKLFRSKAKSRGVLQNLLTNGGFEIRYQKPTSAGIVLVFAASKEA
jgi:ubiquinone/menaquinone biosynthesis C-methylase UbiE